MLSKIKGLHLEPTTKCTLKCPRCSRTELITDLGKLWKNYDLDLTAFKKFLDIDGLDMNICGTHGDPLYYPQLLDLISFVKSKKSKVSIDTNGSYQKEDWWHKLAKMLDKDDNITFSIDGLPENFTQYRIGADWDSIKKGIGVLREYSVQVTWKYIIFRYNENDIDDARKLSKSLGVNEFVVVNSSRWIHDDDPLQPLSGRGALSISKISWKQNKNIEIDPVCKKTNRSHYISANGFYSPCCKDGDMRFFYKGYFYKNKDVYQIKSTTLSKLLSDEKTINFYDNIEKNKFDVCTFSCPKGIVAVGD